MQPRFSKQPLFIATWTGAKPSQVGARMRICSAPFANDATEDNNTAMPASLINLFMFIPLLLL